MSVDMPFGFGNYSLPALNVLAQLQRESIDLLHTYAGTEHLLLAFFEDPNDVPYCVMYGLHLTKAAARQAVVDVIGMGSEADDHTYLRRYTPRLHQLLTQVLPVVTGEGHRITPAHLLLALVRQEQDLGPSEHRSVAIMALEQLGITDLNHISQRVHEFAPV